MHHSRSGRCHDNLLAYLRTQYEYQGPRKGDTSTPFYAEMCNTGDRDQVVVLPSSCQCYLIDMSDD